MTVWPRISIVTPSYNQGRFLEETILSVLDQKYPNLEYIIIDGGSTDDSVEIIRRHEGRLAYWVSESDRGQSHAINKGLALASGEYFRYLNSDDLLPPNALFNTAEAFQLSPEADVIVGECILVDEQGGEMRRHQGKMAGLIQILRVWEWTDSEDRLLQESMVFRRDALLEVGGFREDLHYVMDYALWLRLLVGGYRWETCDEPLGVLRRHARTKSSEGHGIDELLDVIRVFLREHGEVIEDRDRLRIISEMPREFATLKLWTALGAYQQGSYREFLGRCLSAVRIYPPVARSRRFWSILAAPAGSWIPSLVRT